MKGQPAAQFVPWFATAAAAVGAVLFAVAPPHELQAKLYLIGYGICHQAPSHSYFLAGRQLPLCARDTGTYLGATGTILLLLVLRGRGRRSGLPAPGVLAALLAGVAFFAIDGLNSFAATSAGWPHLYEPSNLLRLASGLSCGIAIGSLLWPLANYTLWAHSDPQAAMGWPEFLAALGLSGLELALVTSGAAALFWPLALASALSVAILVSLVNALLLVVVCGWERRAESWGQVGLLLGSGLLLAELELALMGLLRAFLERSLPV